MHNTITLLSRIIKMTTVYLLNVQKLRKYFDSTETYFTWLQYDFPGHIFEKKINHTQSYLALQFHRLFSNFYQSITLQIDK